MIELVALCVCLSLSMCCSLSQNSLCRCWGLTSSTALITSLSCWHCRRSLLGHWWLETERIALYYVFFSSLSFKRIFSRVYLFKDMILTGTRLCPECLAFISMVTWIVLMVHVITASTKYVIVENLSLLLIFCISVILSMN